MDISKIKAKFDQRFLDKSGSGSGHEIAVVFVDSNTHTARIQFKGGGFFTLDILLDGRIDKDYWNKPASIGGIYDWQLKIALGQTWVIKDAHTDIEFTITTIDWAGGCCYGELRDNRTGSITPSHRIIHTKGLLSQYWELKNDEEEPITARSIETHTHTQEPDGYKCDRCGDYNTMVAINTPEGTYRCRGCRSSDSMKYSKYHSNRK
jgi:hypothetical protein